MALWQESQAFAEVIAALVVKLPRDGAADAIGRQLVRSAGSIPANIAEGYGRFSQPAYRNHLSIARGSAFESESRLDLLSRRQYISSEQSANLLGQCSKVQRLISTRMRELSDGNVTYAREEGTVYEI
jgi:four helix bundle protein